MMSFAVLCEKVAAEQLDLVTDSRAVRLGSVFIALPGVHVNGADFIEAAEDSGAAYVLCREEDAARCTKAIPVACEDVHKALGDLATARYGTDTLPFPVIGVTGTNGKTTVTYLLDHVLRHSGRATGVIGTVAYRWPGYEQQASMTTPDCIQMHAMLAKMRAAHVQAVSVEVSSHALEQNRLAGIPFSGAVFTNLTQDHMDYHETMDRYFMAKARLFTEVPFADKVMAVCVDDAHGERVAHLVQKAKNLWTFGLGTALEGLPTNRHLQGELTNISPKGFTLTMRLGSEKTWSISTNLVGKYNAQNLLAVQAMGLGLGLLPQDFTCLADFMGVPGRLERIANPKGLNVFVDYAHTPDALENMLIAMREAGFARILCVFGCGGNRDKTKRPLMGEVVARLSDVAILTSDNPRFEEPNAILGDVRPGLAKAKQVVENVDRREAIQEALDMLGPNDALIVAGKGHENTQEINGIKHPFSDQQTIRELLGCA